jgi:hypothetical protein
MVYTPKWQNNFNCGTAGVTVTTANSNGVCGSAITRVLSTDIGAGNSATFSNAWSFVDGLGLRLVQAGANRCEMMIAWDAPAPDVSVGWGMRYLAAPLVTGPILRLYNSLDWDATTGLGKIDIDLSTSNNIFIRDVAAAVSGSNGTAVLIPNTDYWWEFRYQASINSATLSVYPKGNQTTPRATCSLTIPTATSLGSLWLGIGTPSTALTMDWDDIAIGVGGVTPRPDIANTAPVIARVNGAVRAIPVGSSLSDLAFTATDTSQVSSLTAVVTSRPPGSALPTVSGSPTGLNTGSAALTGTATFASLGTYVVTGTAVDDGSPGLSSSVAYTVDTYPPQDTLTWIRTVQPGTDVQYGTQAVLELAYTDGDTSTGTQTLPSPSGAVKWVQTGALPPAGISLRVIGFRNGAGTLTRHIELYKADKTTLVWQTGPAQPTADLVFGGVSEVQTVGISAAGLALIPAATDRIALWWKIVDTIT